MENINKYQEKGVRNRSQEKERIMKDSTTNKNKSQIFINKESKINQASLLQDTALITYERNQIILEITLEALYKANWSTIMKNELACGSLQVVT